MFKQKLFHSFITLPDIVVTTESKYLGNLGLSTLLDDTNFFSMPLHTAYNLKTLFMQRRKTTASAENPKSYKEENVMSLEEKHVSWTKMSYISSDKTYTHVGHN